jgi:hypothetical protein
MINSKNLVKFEFSGEDNAEEDEFLSDPVTSRDMSSISILSAQNVSKGLKGQLIKSRTKVESLENADMCRNIFFSKLGAKAEEVLREYSKYNNKKDQALADMTLRNAVKDFNITKRVAFGVFGIGNPRWKRVMSSRLVKAKEDIEFVNVNAITDDDLNEFKEFVESLHKEPGYPCNHRRQKL